MKSLLTTIFALCLIFSLGNAQVLLTCSNSKTGAKVSLVEKSGQNIKIRVDWNEGSGFIPNNNLAFGNATCSDCNKGVGGGYKDSSGNRLISREYSLLQTEVGKAVTVAWKSSGTIAYCGGDAPATVPGTGALLTCQGSRTNASVNLVSRNGRDIVIRVDWNEGSGFIPNNNLFIGNATCSDCDKGVGGGYKDASGAKLISREYHLTWKDMDEPVSIGWKSSGTINYCGGNTPVSIPGTGT